MISKDELRLMYCDECMTLKEIGCEIDVPQPTVRNWMEKYGIERRSKSEANILKSPIPISKEELWFMYCDEGMSLKEIGREIGISYETVWRWMKEYGIPRRSKSEARLNGDFSGERAGSWKGGLSFGKYCKKFNNAFKESVRERDDYTCQLCGHEQKLNGRKLSVHHIHYDKENCYPDVVSLCISCNGTVNSNRDEWEEFFEDDLARRGLLNWSS